MLFSGKALTLILAVSSHKTPQRLRILEFHMDMSAYRKRAQLTKQQAVLSQACVTMHAESRARDEREDKCRHQALL